MKLFISSLWRRNYLSIEVENRNSKQAKCTGDYLESKI